MEKVIIIGSGAAGWTAAIYAARAGLSPLVIAGDQPGGQMTIAGDVENYPGFEAGIDGHELMVKMQEQALRFGTRFQSDIITSVDFNQSPFLLHGETSQYLTESVVIATGATARWLGVDGEQRYRGRGVSACATCDGFFYKGKQVAVVGGGNTAVEEALYLSGICETVHLIHRRDSLRAEKILLDRLSKRENIIYHWNSVVEKICGGDRFVDPMSHIELKKLDSGLIRDLQVDGLFVAIGHDPATSVFKGKIDLDSNGYVLVEPGTVKTSVDGVFAAGDVADPKYRQAITAAGMGCMAALEIEKWLISRE